VVGATGFIGSHLTEKLVSEEANVLAIARSDRRIENLSAALPNCTFASCDVTSRNEILRLFQEYRPQVVYHLAAQSDGPESFDHIFDCVRNNSIGVGHVLEAAVAAGTEVFVYAGSVKEYGNGATPYRADQAEAPLCSYAIGKSAGWQLCKLVSSMTGMHVTSLRPTFVYGYRQNWNLISYVRDCVLTNEAVQLQGGSQTRDPLYIDDAVSALLSVPLRAEANGQAVPIGGGREVPIADLCLAVMEAMGAHVPIQLNAHPPRLTEIWRTFTDNADANRLLRWSPRVSLEEGLQRTLAGTLNEPVRPLKSAAVMAG
jgi:nucleoside-diphosphate-sugar epimerase